MPEGNSLLLRPAVSEPARSLLERETRIFRRFERQDSGNHGFGVRAGGESLFVKTAGDAAPGAPASASRPAREAGIRRMFEITRLLPDPLLPRPRALIEAADGPVAVYDWFEGVVLRSPEEDPLAPGSAFQRFIAWPPERIERALGAIFDLHARIEAAGFVAVDFYDGSILVDFARGTLCLCDLDEYRDGPFVLAEARLPGSKRFMAPEEFVRGARIDARSNVFTLGRCAAVFLADGSLAAERYRGSPARHAVVRRACAPRPEERWPDVACFAAAFVAAVG